MSWNDARAYCQAIQADLVVIPDEHTLNFLADLSVREGFDKFHIGLKRHPNNLLVFRWVDGSSLVFTRWRIDEPNNITEECAIFASATYNDLSCDNNTRRFVCQQPIEGKLRCIFVKFYWISVLNCSPLLQN
jgi:hypothetical protein